MATRFKATEKLPLLRRRSSTAISRPRKATATWREGKCCSLYSPTNHPDLSQSQVPTYPVHCAWRYYRYRLVPRNRSCSRRGRSSRYPPRLLHHGSCHLWHDAISCTSPLLSQSVEERLIFNGRVRSLLGFPFPARFPSSVLAVRFPQAQYQYSGPQLSAPCRYRPCSWLCCWMEQLVSSSAHAVRRDFGRFISHRLLGSRQHQCGCMDHDSHCPHHLPEHLCRLHIR